MTHIDDKLLRIIEIKENYGGLFVFYRISKNSQ